MSRITRFILTIAIISLISLVDIFAATPPSRQAKYITFSNITSSTVDLTLLKGNGNSRIIVVSEDATIDNPVDSDTPFTDAGGDFSSGPSVNGSSSDIVVDVLTGSDWYTTITNLTPGNTYKVKVFEFNNDGSTPQNAYLTEDGTVNNPRSFSTLLVVNPPTALDSANVTATTADLSWTAASPSPDGYIFTLYVDTQGEGSGDNTYDLPESTVVPFVELDLGDVTTFDITDLQGPSDYKFELKSYIGSTESVPVSAEFFTPDDNIQPKVGTISFSGGSGIDDVVNENDNNTDLTFVIPFDEAMRTWETPTFTFNPSPAGLTYKTGSWNKNGTEFTAIFTFGSTAQEVLGIDFFVDVASVHDLAGNGVDPGNNGVQDLFNIDNVDGVLSNFDYATANSSVQSYCRSGANGDVIVIEIELTEDGYAASGINENNFLVGAQDQAANGDGFGFAQSGGTSNGEGVYIFSHTLTGEEEQGSYNVFIDFDDGAGNETTQLVITDVFNIENTPPIISNENFINTCLKEGAVFSFDFDVEEDGCGDFDATNIVISGLPSGNGVLSAPTITGTGPYNVAYTYTIGTTTPEGAGNVIIDVTDDAGNTTNSTNNAVFNVDKTAPTLSSLTMTSATCVNNGTEKITFTFSGYDDGCGTFDEGDLTVASTSSATPVFDSKTGSGTSGDAYIFTYKLDISDTDGGYDITVNASDDAGNSSTPLAPGGDEFTVDNTKPTFSSVSMNTTCENGGNTVTLTFTATEDGCGTFDENDITITDDVTTATDAWSYSTGGPGSGVYTYTLPLASGDPDGLVTVSIDATDDAGNAATTNTVAAFTIDNTAPVISNLAVDKTCLKGDSTVTLTFDVAESGCGTFDQNNITIGDNATTANSWTFDSESEGTFTYTLLIDGNDDDDTAVNITVDATDNAGNSATQGVLNSAFAIDNTDPIVAINEPDGSGSNNGSKVIDFTVTEEGCGTPVTEASFDNTIWTTVTSATSTLADVTGFSTQTEPQFTFYLRTTDGAGNVSLTQSLTDSLDLTKPTISSITPSDLEISIADNGNPFTITIEFDELMDNSGDNDPIVTITANNTLPTTNTGGNWQNLSTFVAEFGIINVSTAEAIEDLDVTVSGARDNTEDVGNLMDEETVESVFSIDTEAPTISFDVTSPAADDCVNGAETVEFTAADASTYSGLTNVQAKFAAGTYAVVTSGFTLSTTNGWGAAAQGTGTLYLLATDDFGNTTEITRDLNKDDIDPVISALSVSPGCNKEGDIIDITFTLTEAGCGTVDAGNISITGLPTGNGVLSSPTITGTAPGPYGFAYTYTVGSTDSDGDYTVLVDADDDAGNDAVQAGGAEVSDFSIDNTGPTLSNLVVNPSSAGGTTTSVDISFDAAEFGCSELDATSVVYTFTGPGTLDGESSLADPTFSGGTWTTTLSIASTDVTGNYHISISAADGLGNLSNTLDPAGVELVIDNTPPQVFDVSTSLTPPNKLLNRADDDGSSPEFYIDVQYNEPLNISVVPTIEFHISGKNPVSAGAMTQVGSGTNLNSSTFRYTYDLDKDSDIDMRQIAVRFNGAQDVAGNVQTTAGTQSNLFSIDFVTPQVNQLTVENPTSTVVTDTTSQLELLWEFTEDMNISTTPTITFPGADPNIANVLTLNTGSSDWELNKFYRAIFDVNPGFGLDIDNISVGFTNATDLAGNPTPGSTESNVFSIDTEEPACDGLVTTPSPPVVNLNNLDFEVEVTLDQALDPSVYPVITFASSTSFDIDSSADNGYGFSTNTNPNDRFTFKVTHNGTTEENIDDELITVGGFSDIPGNIQTVACSTTVDIDTDKPDITSLTVSDDKICVADDGASEVITITFDEEMNSAVAPVITFDADLLGNGVLTFSTGSWNSPTNTVYTATYTIETSGEFTLDDVDVIVDNAEDVLGNPMLTDNTSGANKIDVDTELPTVSNIAFNPIPSNAFGVNRSNIGAGGFEVVITYDEAMDAGTTPSISFNPPQGGTGTVGQALTIGSGSWNSPTNTIFTQLYTVNDANVELDGVDATITNGQDLCGNVQNSSNPEPSFAIDLIAPTCSTLVVDTDPIYEDDLTQGLTVTFSEPMSNTVNPTFAFAESENFTTFTGGAGWVSNVFTINANHNGTEEEIPIEIVSLDLVSTQPIDLAGNPVESAGCTDQFEIDTRKPLVSSVEFNPTKVIGTTSELSVTVTFDEQMNILVTPTIVFSAGSTTLTSDGGSWNVDTTVYTANYDVTDMDFEGTGITVDISLAEDVAGNVMLTHTSTETFNIDQVEPTVTSVTFSSHPGWINRSDIGNGNFTVTVVYDESMDDVTNPTISLDELNSDPTPSIDDALVFASGSWTTTTNTNDTYIATYDVVDVAAADEQLGATISGGEDACGNVQVPYSTNSERDGVIDIDLVNPTITLDEPTPLAESCVSGDETINFTADDVILLDKVQARIGTNAFADIDDGDAFNTLGNWGSTSDGPITIELKALDLAGNETVISRSFNKDVAAPVISGEEFTNTCVTTNGVVDIDFTITEVGCGTIEAGNITIGGLPTGNGTLSSPLISSSSPYSVHYEYTIGSTDAEGAYNVTIDVTDDAGNDATTSVTNSAFTIDKTAPSYTVDTPPSPTCTNNSSDFVVTIQSNDFGGCGTYGLSNISASTSLGVATVTNPVADFYNITVDLSGTDNTDDGTYDIDIVMTDAAGNVRNETISNAFTIDNTKPVFSNFQITGEDGSCLAGGSLLEFSVDVTEAGCGTFDESDIVIGVNGSVTNSIVAQEGNPTGSGIYKFELLIENGDASGEYNLTFNGTDAAGNDATGYAPSGVEFKIDNTNPVIAITNPTTGATVNGTKAVAFTATDGSGCGLDYSEFSVNGSTWTNATSVSTLSDISGFTAVAETTFTLTLRTFDLAGNSSTASVNLTKDVTGPSVIDATASDDLLSIADGGNAFTVAVTFDEGMDETVDPTVTLTTNGTVASTNTGGSWNSPTNTIFTATFGTINGGSDEEIDDLDVTVSGAKDDTEDDGNTMVFPETISDIFSIDTKAPTCSTLVVDTDPIYEGDLIQGTTVTFSEPMDKTSLTSLNVDSFFDITFNTEFSSSNFNWDGPGGSFTVDLEHSGVQQEVPIQIVQLSLTSVQPTDLAGNPMQSVGCSDQFEIDTRKPLVDNIVFTPTLVTEATTTFSVAVEFDETMSSTAPTLTFNGGVSSAFSPAGGDAWVGNTYTFNYSVSDQDFNLTGLTVDISGAKDVAGNTMATHTSLETYNIDQLAPTITDATIVSDNTIDSEFAGEGHVVSLTITPSEELDVNEFSGNIAGITIGSVTDNFSSTGKYVIPVTITSSESEGLVSFSIDYEDLNGNSNSTSLTAVTDGSSVTIDLTSPEGEIDQAVAQNDPTDNSPINFTVEFNENVYSVDGTDFTLSGTAGATTATVTGSGTTYNVAVSGMTGSGTVILDISGTHNITDVAANSATVTTDDNQVTYNVAGATIVDIGPGSEPFTLSSTVDTQGEASLNFDFNVTDDGGTPGADLLATLITDIEISHGSGNDITDWTDVIGGAILTDGTNTISASSINSTDIQFNGLSNGSNQIGEVQDNATKTYQLKVWLLSSPAVDIDNENLAFKVNRSSFTVDGAGSSFESGPGIDIQSGSTNNEIDVDATKLAFVSSPANTEIDTDTEFEIEATDDNGNLDSDYGPSTVTLTADQSTITSGGSGTMNSGTLTLSSVRFDASAENDFVTASDGNLTDGVSNTFNIKEEEPLPITNLSIIPSKFSFKITYSNRDTANTLILAKKTGSVFAYNDEAGMDNETGWPTPSTSFGTSAAPSGSGVYVIYSGQDSSLTMTNLQNGFQAYAVTAYSFRGALNSGVQNFNETEQSKVSYTQFKESDYSDDINNGLRLGIDNITPQPASINGNVSLEIETINEMPLSLELYDSKGEKVMVIFNNREFKIGETPFEFNINRTISSGQYFLRLSGNGEVVIAPLTIVN